MLIEPVATSPRGRAGRARALAAIAAPVVLLVAVVGAGALATDGRTGTEIHVAARPVPAPSTAAVGAATDQGPTAIRTAGFPPRVLGLPARTVAEALDARRAGTLGDELVAVRGYLTVRRGGLDCVAERLDPPEAFCRRDTILRDDDDPAMTWQDGVLRSTGPRGFPHLHPQVFPGVGLGPVAGELAGGSATAGGTTGAPAKPDGPVRPVPVIVIGRFDDPRVVDVRANARHVDEGFTIERLAWADGRWQDRRLTRVLPWAPGDLDLRTSRAVAAAALPGGTVILSQSMLSVDTLAALDAGASGAARAAATTGAAATLDRLWYIRAMTRSSSPADSLAEPGAPRRLGWIVLANDGTVLATHPEG